MYACIYVCKPKKAQRNQHVKLIKFHPISFVRSTTTSTPTAAAASVTAAETANKAAAASAARNSSIIIVFITCLMVVRVKNFSHTLHKRQQRKHQQRSSKVCIINVEEYVCMWGCVSVHLQLMLIKCENVERNDLKYSFRRPQIQLVAKIHIDCTYCQNHLPLILFEM